jgi:hypothetical protein
MFFADNLLPSSMKFCCCFFCISCLFFLCLSIYINIKKKSETKTKKIFVSLTHMGWGVVERAMFHLDALLYLMIVHFMVRTCHACLLKSYFHENFIEKSCV